MPGTKSYRPWSPDQPFLMPPNPGEWLPEDHLARFVLELIRELGSAGPHPDQDGRDGHGHGHGQRQGRSPEERTPRPG